MSTTDELREAAKVFLVEHYSKITLGDALTFMSQVKRVHVPFVLSVWREHGLTATFLLEVAVSLLSDHKEPA